MHSRTLTLIFCIILSLTTSTAEYSDIIGLSKKVYKLDGDIMIGGVFPLHQSGPNGTFCGKLRELGVHQRAEAMAFYIQQANKDWKRQGINITLGFTILDDCYKVRLGSQNNVTLHHNALFLASLYALVSLASSILMQHSTCTWSCHRLYLKRLCGSKSR